MKRIVRAFLLILFMLALSVGGQIAPKPGEAVVEKEKAVMEIWAFFGSNTPGEHYIGLWDELAEEYHVEIDLKVYSTEQMRSKLRIALVCNEMPDAFLVWGGTYPEFLIEAGACMPVQEVIEASGIPFKEAYVMPYEDGNNYIIPCLPEDYAVTYYNQELVERMGLNVPDTWEELLELVEDVNEYNAAHNTRYAAINLGNKNGREGELLFCSIVNRLEPDAYEELKQGLRSFEDAVFQKAAQMVCELEEADAFSYDFMEVGEAEAVENFANNEAVIFPSCSSMMYYLMEKMGEEAFHIIPFPSCNEEYADTYAFDMIDINHTMMPGFCISAASEYKNEAAEICLEFSRRVNEVNVSEYGAINMMENETALGTEWPTPVEEFQRLLRAAEEFSADWYAELPLEAADAWTNLTKKLYAGELDAVEFIEKGTEYFGFHKKY